MMLSESTLSCDIIQIHSLFCHGFIKKPKSKFNRNRNRRILFLCSRFRKSDLRIDLISKAFRGSIQNTRLFSIFSSFICCSIIYLFEKRKGAYSCLPSKDSLNYSLSLFKGCFYFRSFYLSTKCFLFVYMYIDLLKLKAYKLFENSDADLPWLLFLKKTTCSE